MIEQVEHNIAPHRKAVLPSKFGRLSAATSKNSIKPAKPTGLCGLEKYEMLDRKETVIVLLGRCVA